MWISVKDRLPEMYTMVLVYESSFARTDERDAGSEYSTKRPKGVRLGYLASVGFRPEGCNGDYNITHWQPLPEPPEE